MAYVRLIGFFIVQPVLRYLAINVNIGILQLLVNHLVRGFLN